MKRRLALILILMSCCVGGIIGLQLYWNYQNYRRTTSNFRRDINEALRVAVTREIDLRHRQIVSKVKHWLADTSFIQITCTNANRYHETVFNMKDAHPVAVDDTGVSLGITSFKESLSEITPEAKGIFIDHFGNSTLMGDLKKGIIYFYTQRLGDSLAVIYEKSKMNAGALAGFYSEALESKNIRSPFLLHTSEPGGEGFFLTQKVNTALRRSYEKEFVHASFESPDMYFLKSMKWLIVSTLLLISITLFCFGYTVRTLLSQQKLAELKDNFISNMTHELNTPLTAIRITAEALKAFRHDPQTEREYLDIISFQAERLTILASQILETNRLTRNTKNVRDEINLDTIIKKAVQSLTPHYRASCATISYQPYQESLYVRGEPADLLTSFTNIMDNALKYSSGNPKLDITLTARNGYAEIAFADNGPGIPEMYRSKVFQQFFRVPQGNTHDVKGYGLGLSYVREVVEQHHGSVSVLSNNPAGSVFTIKLPLCLWNS